MLQLTNKMWNDQAIVLTSCEETIKYPQKIDVPMIKTSLSGGKGDSISPYLPMSDFCIDPHSGIPQGPKGLILVNNPLREPWFRILPSGGAPLPPSLVYVTRTAIDQYHSNLMRRDEGKVPLSGDGRAGVWHG
jgi:hypothetical protein